MKSEHKTVGSRIPPPIYFGISLDYNVPPMYGIYSHDGYWSWDYHVKTYVSDDCHRGECDHVALHKNVLEYIKTYQQEKNCKVIMAGLANCNDKRLHHLGKLLWNELDVLPCTITTRGETIDEKACSVARKSSQLSTQTHVPGLIKTNVGYRHEVEVDGDGSYVFTDLAEYSQYYDDSTFKEILTHARRLKSGQRSIVFLNSTPQGGGVATMRHSLVRFSKLLGIEIHWFVMKPNPEVFEITKKKFHNVLHGVAPNDTILTDEEVNLWKRWCQSNVERYWSDPKSPMLTADMIIIDDPQPSACIPLLKALNPNARFVYRSHIEVRSDLIMKENTIQNRVWNVLWENIQLCDIFVSHPIDSFVPPWVPKHKIVRMPATLDPFDGLNKDLDSYSSHYYSLVFNRFCLDQAGTKVNFERPYFAQICRFDPSKGIPDLIDAYVSYRKRQNENDNDGCPQLVICGHGAIDDPEGGPIYEATIAKIESMDIDECILRDIHVVRLPPSDHLLNMILCRAHVVFQLSIREGFEIKVTEALFKGKPVVAYKTGGIPLQITHEKDGLLIESGDIDAVVDAMEALAAPDSSLHAKLSKGAEDKSRHNLMTPMNALRWYRLCP